MRRLFVFDWDGTLMDSVGRIVSCLRRAAEEQGLEDLGDARFGDVIGLGLPQAIAQRYESYLVERASGGTESGVIGDQTPASVTLRQPGRETVIPRRDIRSMSVVPQSAMPPDLDQLITAEEMADLLTFLTSDRRR